MILTQNPLNSLSSAGQQAVTLDLARLTQATGELAVNPASAGFDPGRDSDQNEA